MPGVSGWEGFDWEVNIDCWICCQQSVRVEVLRNAVDFSCRRDGLDCFSKIVYGNSPVREFIGGVPSAIATVTVGLNRFFDAQLGLFVIPGVCHQLADRVRALLVVETN